MNEPTPTTPDRRKRRQAMSDDGRLILQRERQRLVREQAVLGERLANEARRNDGWADRNERRIKPEDAAVQRGIVKRIAAVLSSEGVNVRLDVGSSSDMTAWTDFEQIHVRYRQTNDIRLLSAVLRALMYHEGGHCKHTLPYPDLKDLVDPTQVPGLLPPLNEDGTQPKPEWGQFHKAWNALEDQRMETAVVSESPTKAMYLTPMMMTELMETPAHAVANWPLTIWRRYLPRKLRAAARRDFVAIHGEAVARSFEAVVDTYVRATDVNTMMAAVVEMAYLLDRAKIEMKDLSHDHQRKRRIKAGGDPIELPQIPIDPIFDEADEADEDDEIEMAPVINEGKAEGETLDIDIGLPAEADHSKSVPPLTQEDIDQEKEEAEAERDADTTLDDDVDAYHDALQGSVSGLAPYVGGFHPNEFIAVEAEQLAHEIQQSFEAATMDRQPAWVEQQRRGVINVARYETRQPGDTEFYRDWVEDDQPGFNMAVSLMLDYSSSMFRYTDELAQTAYAVKLACQRLNIPCTVTLWDHSATVLFDANEDAQGMPLVNTAGWTDPSTALADLENQRFDKVNHVVMIMTDGEWQGDWEGKRKRNADKATLAYHAHERVMVGFGFDTLQSSANRYRDNLLAYGCPEAFGITNLMEIPERLREILIALA